MALLWIEGFEGMGTSDGSHPSPTGILSRKYPTVVYPDYMWLVAGRTGGHGLNMNGVWAELYTSNLTTNATMVVGFAYYYTATYQARIVTLYDGAQQGVNLRQATGGELAVYRDGTLLATTSGLGLQTGTWYWIELKVVCGDSGSYELRVGGINKLSASGVDTKAGSNDYHTRVGWIGPANGAMYIDDIYILDGSGSANNDFLGNVKVVAIVPDGDVSGYQDFTPSAGSDHYALVDENPVNDDTDYVESGTTGHKDLWTYVAASGLGTTIAGIQINTMVRETDAESFSLKTLIKSDTTEDEGAGEVIGSTSYKMLKRISETDPATAAAWTSSGVNAAQFGVKVG